MEIPNVLPWPTDGGIFEFLNIYDWDQVFIDSSGSALLAAPIVLCTSIFPCKLEIHGESNETSTGLLYRKSTGTISCLDQNLCLGMTVRNMNVTCLGPDSSDSSIFNIQGANLILQLNTFYSCNSSSDGSIVKSYEGATVQISRTTFKNLHTTGLGAAISAVGSTLNISFSKFYKCSANAGGGAIWVSSFQYFGSNYTGTTNIYLEWVSFDYCSSQQDGGSILVSFNTSSTNFNGPVGIFILSSSFAESEALGDGGAMKIYGSLVNVVIVDTIFRFCQTRYSGGAVSGSDRSVLILENVLAVNNSASGEGGGALHVQNANLSLKHCLLSGNEARAGGGGALLWLGETPPDTADDVSKICGSGNSGLFGPCYASDYKSLDILQYPHGANAAYSGIPFEVVVFKKDFYNQTIVTDSISALQVFTSFQRNFEIDPDVTVTGSTVSKMSGGAASFSVAIVPTFSNISFKLGLTTLQSPPYIYFVGTDLEANPALTMRSKIVRVDLNTGLKVCPLGYVLRLDSDSLGDPEGPAACDFCQPGTYSVDPLAPRPASSSLAPSCLLCPAGGNCISGGSNVIFSIGDWVISSGMYRLISCPVGFQLTNSTQGTSDGIFSHDNQQCGPCLPGYFQDLQICSQCKAEYYCTGDVAAPCPSGTFSQAGSDSYTACFSAVYVSVEVSLALNFSDFSGNVETRFEAALASAAGLSADRVSILSANQQRRTYLLTPYISLRNPSTEIFREDRRSFDAELLVVSDLATDNYSSATTVSQRVDSTSLNMNLRTQGLPPCTSVSVTISPTSDASSSSLPLVIGACVGGITLFFAFSWAGFYLRRYLAWEKFLETFRDARAGDAALEKHLPPEDDWSLKRGAVNLRMHYTTETVLGKGSSGCVVKATKKSTGETVAIKIIVPKKRPGIFDGEEKRQLTREGELLQLVTKRKCKFAVHDADSEGLHERCDVCCFIVEALDGVSLDMLSHPVAIDSSPMGELACIQVARDVLAALKVVHSEGWVHCDVTPANIVRCTVRQFRGNSNQNLAMEHSDLNEYEYKLIDFGSTVPMLDAVQSNYVFTGTPRYRAPELLEDSIQITAAADLWSLGVNIFELIANRFPFTAGAEGKFRDDWSASVPESFKTEDVCKYLAEFQRESISPNFAKIISKALQKKPVDRSGQEEGPFFNFCSIP